MIENRMLVNSEWEELERNLVPISENYVEEKGYREIGTDEFVPDEVAYEYALSECLSGNEELHEEFKAMLIEWFFSGNWVREE